MKSLVYLMFFVLFLPASVNSQTLTPGEKKFIESNVSGTFETIISFWKDQNYSEIYEYGYRSSQMSMSREAFEFKMKNKHWIIASSWEGVREIEIEVISFTSAYVRAKMGFRPKLGGDTRTITETFHMMREGDKWRIGLYKIISCPN